MRREEKRWRRSSSGCASIQHGIAAKYLEPDDRLDDEVERSFDKFKNHVPRIIEEWNQEYAHVLPGGASVILQEFKTAEGDIGFKLLSSAAFKEWNAEHRITLAR